MFIISFLTGTIGRYLLMAVLGIGFLAWIRADAAAPYRHAVTELREASQRKDEIIQRDAERQLDDMQREAQLKERLDAILKDSSGSCKLSGDDIERLRVLASGK